ncbi:MAG TPA: hypothetical protein ENK19_03030 [Acidobacteria bacterium]|nr:hypothetical protein [Acidobacteriota bacterium]
MYCPNPSCPDHLANGVPGEYREGTERCPYCGELLAPGSPPEAEAPQAPAERPVPGGGAAHHEVTVFVARDPAEAAMTVGLLEQNGIACFRRVEGLGGETAFFSARWAPVPGQRYEIVVSSAAERAARRLLEETLGPEAVVPAPSPPVPSPSPPPDSPHHRRDDETPPRVVLLLLLLGFLLVAGVLTIILRSLN